MVIPITQFCADPGLLNNPLWPKQSEILEDFWSGNYQTAVWALGRRSGKTMMAACLAVYAATMLSEEYKARLRRGERFYIISVANNQDQARIALQAVKDLIINSPILAPLIVRETADSLELSNGAVFRALPASSRGGRGMACPLLILDEAGHFLDTESNQAGGSLYQALAPSVAQFGKLGKILVLSSPWLQQGLFFDLFQQAKSGNFPGMQAVNLPTWEVNPTISQEWLDQERSRDPEMFAVEFGANFSQSLSGLLNWQLVDASVVLERTALFPHPKFKGKYVLSLDPAKGGRDAYTACIAHAEGDRLIVDLFHEFKATVGGGKSQQFNVAEIEEWIIAQHEAYKFCKVALDQYNSQSTIQRLTGKMPIEELTWTADIKTKAFTRLRELVNAGHLELYPHPKAVQQLKNLTVQYRANGTWNVTGGAAAAVDDYALALAGACHLTAKPPAPVFRPAKHSTVQRYFAQL